jgi:predicted TIM-barrel fold metal-dependent hydrolase
VRGVRACESWLGQAARLMRRYRNVFGDLSGSSLNEGRARAAAYATLLVPLLADESGFANRLMYGSDWWLQRLFGGEATYLEDFQTSWTGLVSGRPALLAAVLGGNALRFLGFGSTAPTRNATRLRAFYATAGATPPAWL